MQSFVKKMFYLSILLISCLTFFISETFADTLLDGVEIESGYRNYNVHRNDKNATVWVGFVEECSEVVAYPNFGEFQGESDWSWTWTYDSGQVCSSESRIDSWTYYGTSYSPQSGDICKSCTVPSFSNTEGCGDYRYDPIIMFAGSVTSNYLYDYSGETLKGYEQLSGICSLSPPVSWGWTDEKGDSSYTFRIKCEGEKIASILRIEAEVGITSESQASGVDFLMNGNRPFYIQQIYAEYWENQRVYAWRGKLSWDIPIYKRCGENITVTPSLTSGYGYTTVGTIRAIFGCAVDVNVSPSEVRPEKTGNNKADVVLTLANPAPSGGVDVRLSVDTGEYLGGHSHDGSRPKGGITDKDGNKTDTIFFAEGETTKTVKYKATEVSGEEKIIAEVKEAKCEAVVRVKVPGLGPIPESVEGYWRLTGSYGQPGVTSKHIENHYGTLSTKTRIAAAAYDYFEETGVAIGVNDMSLPWGGLFDIGNNWSSSPGHKWHRTGKSVDVDHLGVDEDILDGYAEEYGCERYEVNLIHYECP